MRIHLDTNLLISKPQWELLPPGDHEYLVSALVFAEFSEGTAHPDPDIAARALKRRHRVLQGILVPLAHRLRGYRTLHYELTADPVPASPGPEAA